MNYYDVYYERGDSFSSNIVKAVKESDIRHFYEAKGANKVKPEQISEERAMASIRNHPGKPIVEIPEIKEEGEEFEIGEELYYTPDLMGEELTFTQLFDMIGERVFLMTDPDGNKPLEQQKAVVARVNSIVAYEGEIEDAVLDFDNGREPFSTLEFADFSEKYHREARSRAWRIKKAEEKELSAPIVSDSGTDLKNLALKKDILNSLVHIGIQTIEELKEHLDEVRAKFPPDWYDKIIKALNIQQDIDEGEKKSDLPDLPDVPDFPEPLETVAMPNEYDLARQADELVNNGLKLAQIGISQMCRGVKMMHDGKLYKQFGFQNFEEYCKSKGFSREHGTRLVKISEMLEQENVTPGSHFEKLGLTVLKLLAPLEPEQREQIAQTVDLETISKRDLEKEIKELKIQHEKALAAEKVKVEALKRDKENAYGELSKANQRLAESKIREEHLRRENTEKDLQIQELESRPIEHEYVQSDEELKRIQELEGQNELIANENSELEAENKELTVINSQLERELQEARQKSDSGRGAQETYRFLVQTAKEAIGKVQTYKKQNPGLPGCSYDELHQVFLMLADIEAQIIDKNKKGG